MALRPRISIAEGSIYKNQCRKATIKLKSLKGIKIKELAKDMHQNKGVDSGHRKKKSPRFFKNASMTVMSDRRTPMLKRNALTLGELHLSPRNKSIRASTHWLVR